MPLEWQVIAMGCGALVLTLITSLRPNHGTAPEGSDSDAQCSRAAVRMDDSRSELAQKLPNNATQ